MWFWAQVFLGLPVSLVAVTIGCSGASVPGWGVGFGCGLVDGGVVALTTRPLGQHGSTPSPDPSARQSAPLAEL